MIYKLADIQGPLLDLRRNGLPQGHLTGWNVVDEIYRPELGFFTVITGIPSHGKSEFLDMLLVNMGILHGWKFGVYSPENYPIESHFNRLIERYCGDKCRCIMTDEYKMGAAFVDRHFHFIYPKDDAGRSIDDILDHMLQAKRLYGMEGFVIDPWNELDHRREHGLSETEYVSQVLSKIRFFCRENKVHGWLVAHPTKMQKDKETGQYEIPTPYNIAGSAAFYNKADHCVTVHREDLTKNEPILLVQKAKFKNFGKIGNAQLYYQYVSGRISEVDKYFDLPVKGYQKEDKEW